MPMINNYAIAVVLCLYSVCQTVIATITQYIYLSFLQKYPYPSNTTENLTITFVPTLHRLKSINDVSRQCVNNASTSGAQIWAQEQSADLYFHIDLCNSCPVVIMTIVLGFFTPKLGRRLVLMLPILGIMGQLSIGLAVIYFHLPDYWWCVGSFMVGLSGSGYVFQFVMSLIITDNVTENNRSSRFVLLEAMTTAVTAVATVCIGYYIAWRGFTDLYWFSLGLGVILIGIVLVFFKGTTQSTDERTPLLSSSDGQQQHSPSLRESCQNCMVIFRIFSFKDHSRRKSTVLLLTLLAYTFYLLANATYTTFLWYLLNSPFCWTSKDIGNYVALAAISSAIFSVLGMTLFTYLRASNIVICTISHVFFAASSLWITFARHSWQLYVGLLISPYADYQSALTLPIMSSWLQAHEQNHAFALVAEVNTIVTTFGQSIFDWVYARTVANFRNATLFIAVGFSLVSFASNICLLFVTRGAPKPLILPVVDKADAVEDQSQPPSQSSLNEETAVSNDLVIL